MLSQMKMAGMLELIQGVVTGDFEDCREKKYIPQIMDEIFSDLNVPVCMGTGSRPWTCKPCFAHGGGGNPGC